MSFRLGVWKRVFFPLISHYWNLKVTSWPYDQYKYRFFRKSSFMYVVSSAQLIRLECPRKQEQICHKDGWSQWFLCKWFGSNVSNGSNSVQVDHKQWQHNRSPKRLLVDLLHLQDNNLITFYDITNAGSRRSILKCKRIRTTILDRCKDCVQHMSERAEVTS